MTEPDVIGKPQTDAALDRGSPIHMQNQTIKHPAQSHTEYRWDPSKQEVQGVVRGDIEKSRMPDGPDRGECYLYPLINCIKCYGMKFSA